jgi:hypothetical protein
MGQIGEPTRRYTVIPLEEPVSPTNEPVTPPPPNKAPNPTHPLGTRNPSEWHSSRGAANDDEQRQ